MIHSIPSTKKRSNESKMTVVIARLLRTLKNLASNEELKSVECRQTFDGKEYLVTIKEINAVCNCD